MGESSLGTTPPVKPALDRLDSWKEIAAYLKRDVTTVQRWEKREGMPVHRHLHDMMGSVYASRADLDAWARSRNLRAAQENENNAPTPNPSAQPPRSAISGNRARSSAGQRKALVAGVAVVAITIAVVLRRRPAEVPRTN